MNAETKPIAIPSLTFQQLHGQALLKAEILVVMRAVQALDVGVGWDKVSVQESKFAPKCQEIRFNVLTSPSGV